MRHWYCHVAAHGVDPRLPGGHGETDVKIHDLYAATAPDAVSRALSAAREHFDRLYPGHYEIVTIHVDEDRPPGGGGDGAPSTDQPPESRAHPDADGRGAGR